MRSSPDGAPAGWQPPEQALRPASRPGRLVLPLLLGAAVAVGLGAYGRLHEPAGYAVQVIGFSGGAYVKAWLGSLAAVLGALQLVSAGVLNLHGNQRTHPRWVAVIHRWTGRLAVLVSVPVAVHCLYAFGFQSGDTRVWIHSIAGCVFYGAFTAKMLSLSRPGIPRWAVPLLGGLAFTILVTVWLTSALWLFSRQGVHL